MMGQWHFADVLVLTHTTYDQLDYVTKATEGITTTKLYVRPEEPSIWHRWAYVKPTIFKITRGVQMVSDIAKWWRCCLRLLALKTKQLRAKENRWPLDSRENIHFTQCLHKRILAFPRFNILCHKHMSDLSFTGMNALVYCFELIKMRRLLEQPLKLIQLPSMTSSNLRTGSIFSVNLTWLLVTNVKQNVW